MKVTFIGATHEVTGSCSLLEVGNSAFLVDCGMEQGENRETMAANLNRLVAEKGFHLNTGFTGTPYLLFALADNGYVDTAYRVLMQDTCPSWLYCVRMGATTFWEQWNTITPDGKVRDPSMNHYAYGAVGDWMYEVAAGIAPDEAQPGFAHIHFAPASDRRLQFVRASIETQRGTVASEWEIHGDTVRYCFHVPRGATAEIRIAGQQFFVREGEHRYQFPYGSGR